MNKSATGPLEGMTILDFTSMLSGPQATKHLRDLGAEVLKVEVYKEGSAERKFALLVNHRGVEQSSYFINVNRGKRSLCINMKNPKGMALIQALIRKSDVVIENDAPGIMAKVGLDYESVKTIKEDIIYCSISCFGQTSPYSDRPACELIAQAACGWTGQGAPPTQASIGVTDQNAASHAVTAILAAVLYRDNTGKGQQIDLSTVDCLFSLHENCIPWYLISTAAGEQPPKKRPPIGKYLTGYAPYGIYTGKNGTLVAAMLTDARWPALLDVLGPYGDSLRNDERFNTVSARCTTENSPYVHQAMEDWVMSMDSVEEAARILDETGIPCMVSCPISELADRDPQVKAREMMVTVDQPFIGPMQMFGSPFKLSKTPSIPRGHAPFLGEHNRVVLSKLLGLSQAEIDALYQEDVLYHEPCVDKLDKIESPAGCEEMPQAAVYNKIA